MSPPNHHEVTVIHRTREKLILCPFDIATETAQSGKADAKQRDEEAGAPRSA